MSTPRTELKIALIGSSASGKTALLERVLHNTFSQIPQQYTIGVQIEFWTFGDVKVIFYDGGSNVDYQPLIQRICAPCNMFLVCYDNSSITSYAEALKILAVYRLRFPSKKFYLIANKADLAACIKKSVVKKTIPADVQFLQVSAKSPRYGNPTVAMKHIISMALNPAPSKQSASCWRYFCCCQKKQKIQHQSQQDPPPPPTPVPAKKEENYLGLI